MIVVERDTIDPDAKVCRLFWLVIPTCFLCGPHFVSSLTQALFHPATIAQSRTLSTDITM